MNPDAVFLATELPAHRGWVRLAIAFRDMALPVLLFACVRWSKRTLRAFGTMLHGTVPNGLVLCCFGKLGGGALLLILDSFST